MATKAFQKIYTKISQITSQNPLFELVIKVEFVS